MFIEIGFVLDMLHIGGECMPVENVPLTLGIQIHIPRKNDMARKKNSHGKKKFISFAGL
jgi:hypothetical protein